MRTLLAVAALTLFPVFALAAAPAAEPDASKFPPDRRIIHNFTAPAGKAPVKIAFFDADSTLRVAPSGSVSANGPTDVAVLPLLVPQLKKLQSEGYLLAVASNQAGIAAGYVTFDTANGAIRFALSQLSRLGVQFHYYDFAEANNEDRKPDIGMARRLQGKIEAELGRKVDWANTIMVGDSAWKKGADVEPDGTPGEDVSNADRLFGENMLKTFGGVKFYHPRNFFAWMRYGVRNFHDFKSVLSFVAEHPELDPGLNPASAPAPAAAPATAAAR